jgi:hypothetical protein
MRGWREGDGGNSPDSILADSRILINLYFSSDADGGDVDKEGFNRSTQPSWKLKSLGRFGKLDWS